MDWKTQLTLSPWTKRILAVVALGAVFGTIGYIVSPKSAKASLTDESLLKALRTRIQAESAGKDKAQKQFQDIEKKLAAAGKTVEDTRQQVASEKAKVSAAEKFIVDLNTRLEVAKNANEPMRQKLESTEKQAADAQAAADQATARAEDLSQQVGALRGVRTGLEQFRDRLLTEKANLEQSLGQQNNVVAEMRMLMGALNFNRNVSPPAKASAGEMPITRREMIAWMGHPALSYKSNNGGVKMRWGWGWGSQPHSAIANDDVITEIDGQPATRALLASIAEKAPTAPAPAAPWRLDKDQAVRYADVVAMFGQPEGVSGSGSRFTAWWSVGAWARRATATVADGIVTGFDDGSVDPARLCELARHRAEAYKSANAPLTNDLKLAKTYYEQARQVVGDKMAKENELHLRDGVRLKAWHFAPFDSVGVWVAPTSAPADSMTVRAWLDCTWVDSVGTELSHRRYVVVTIKDKSGGMEVADLAIFAPRS